MSGNKDDAVAMVFSESKTNGGNRPTRIGLTSLSPSS